jgi:hypothetical protein
MATPDWNAWLASVWGPSVECSGPGAIIALASNVTVGGSNPSYTLQDYLTFYPKWGGTPVASVTFTGEEGGDEITVNSASGLAVGNPVMGDGIPDGTFITGINDTTVTLSNELTENISSATALTVWNTPLIPFAVLQAYIALATASLAQCRWGDTWMVGIGLFVSHFATLYAQSDGNPNATVSQAASSGLSTGVQVAKAVGDVSVAYQAVSGIDDWAAWNLTSFGQQLATFAKVIGAGPMFLY